MGLGFVGLKADFLTSGSNSLVAVGFENYCRFPCHYADTQSKDSSLLRCRQILHCFRMCCTSCLCSVCCIVGYSMLNSQFCEMDVVGNGNGSLSTAEVLSSLVGF